MTNTILSKVRHSAMIAVALFALLLSFGAPTPAQASCPPGNAAVCGGGGDTGGHDPDPYPSHPEPVNHDMSAQIDWESFNLAHGEADGKFTMVESSTNDLTKVILGGTTTPKNDGFMGFYHEQSSGGSAYAFDGGDGPASATALRQGAGGFNFQGKLNID